MTSSARRASSAWTISRIAGSVPLGRTRTRPLPASRDSAAETAASTRGPSCDASQLGPGVDAAVIRAESVLGGNGRVLVRPSGTEPAIRLMVQAADAVLAEQVIGQLAADVRLALAGQ